MHRYPTVTTIHASLRSVINLNDPENIYLTRAAFYGYQGLVARRLAQRFPQTLHIRALSFPLLRQISTRSGMSRSVPSIWLADNETVPNLHFDCRVVTVSHRSPVVDEEFIVYRDQADIGCALIAWSDYDTWYRKHHFLLVSNPGQIDVLIAYLESLTMQ